MRKSRAPLSAAERKREVDGGSIAYVDGSPVQEALDEALITEDGRTLYRVSEGIPVMLEEQGISAKQIPGW